MNALTLNNARQLLPKRAETAHKGAVGRVLVLGGSLGMTGAAILSAQAALKMGCGLVTIAAPAAIQHLFETQSPCLMTRAVEDRDGKLGPWSHKTFSQLVQKVDSLVIGPGLGQQAPLQFWLRRSITDICKAKPTVLDADALNALAESPKIWSALPPTTVLTPHPGELSRWHKVTSRQIQDDRQGFLDKSCSSMQAVLLLKGRHTLIGQNDQASFKRAVNKTGNPGLATGGSGDVLSGIIGALLAQGLNAFDAATLGAWIHGRAGDFAAKELGQQALDALSIIEFLPKVLLELAPRKSP